MIYYRCVKCSHIERVLRPFPLDYVHTHVTLDGYQVAYSLQAFKTLREARGIKIVNTGTRMGFIRGKK